MRLKSVMFLVLLIVCPSFAQMLLTPTEILNSLDKYDGKFLGMIGTVNYLETFINGNGERAMKFQLYEDNGNFITVRLAREETWLADGEKINASGVFYKNFGLGMENNLLMISQGNYGESVIPYNEDKTLKLLDGLLKKLIK